MTRTPEPPAWAVFHVWMQATRPAPKYKYFICMHLQGGSALGLLINSQVNELGQGQYLHPCFAPLSAAAHAFLNHNSWADCTTLFTVPVADLTDGRGHLTPEAAQAVQAAVQACPKLKPKTKALLCTVPLPG